jgi:hypothetical protein
MGEFLETGNKSLPNPVNLSTGAGFGLKVHVRSVKKLYKVNVVLMGSTVV